MTPPEVHVPASFNPRRDLRRRVLASFEVVEKNVSGIFPEQTELVAILEEINAREEASETLDAEAGEEVKRKVEEQTKNQLNK